MRRIHKYDVFSTACDEKKIFWKFPLSIVGLARGKAAIGRGRDESFPHVVGRLFRTCGVGVDLARGTERNAAGFCPVISLCLFGAVNRAVPVEGCGCYA